MLVDAVLVVVLGVAIQLHVYRILKNVGIMLQSQAGLEDDWSATAKQMLIDFAKKIKLPNR